MQWIIAQFRGIHRPWNITTNMTPHRVRSKNKTMTIPTVGLDGILYEPTMHSMPQNRPMFG